MTKRGAAGTLTGPGMGRLWLDGGGGKYEVHDKGPYGTRLGRVARERHTYRTAYKGTRIGHDRSHWCWTAYPETMRSSRCHVSMRDAIDALLREA